MATKVSVYLDEQTMERLRQRALLQRGTMRSLSKEIEELVTESFVLDEFEAAFAEEGEAKPVAVGFGDVRSLKIAPGPSGVQMIRKEREHRHETSPRRKRRT